MISRIKHKYIACMYVVCYIFGKSLVIMICISCMHLVQLDNFFLSIKCQFKFVFLLFLLELFTYIKYLHFYEMNSSLFFNLLFFFFIIFFSLDFSNFISNDPVLFSLQNQYLMKSQRQGSSINTGFSWKKKKTQHCSESENLKEEAKGSRPN